MFFKMSKMSVKFQERKQVIANNIRQAVEKIMSINRPSIIQVEKLVQLFLHVCPTWL